MAIKWDRFSPKALRSICESTRRLNIWHGAVRSSKTVSSIVRFLEFIATAPPGDILIIATFAVYNEVELAKHEPDLIYVDSQNRIVRRGHKIPVQAAA